MGARGSGLTTGVVVGLSVAVVYSVVAIGIYVLSGGVRTSPPSELGGILLAYLIAGLVGGAVGGLLSPWRRKLPVAVATGLFGAFVATSGISVMSDGWQFWEWDQVTWEAIAFTTVLLGGTGGYLYWRE